MPTFKGNMSAAVALVNVYELGTKIISMVLFLLMLKGRKENFREWILGYIYSKVNWVGTFLRLYCD